MSHKYFLFLIFIQINFCIATEAEYNAADAVINNPFSPEAEIIAAIQKLENMLSNATPRVLLIKVCFKLAEVYENGIYRQRDYYKAYSYLNSAFMRTAYTKKNYNCQIQRFCEQVDYRIKAAFKIGQFFAEERIYKFEENQNIFYYASLYFEIAYNQDILKDIKYEAAFYLGKIYFEGRDPKLGRSLKEAGKYFDEIMKSNAPDTLRKKAREYIDLIEENIPNIAPDINAYPLIDDDLYARIRLYKCADNEQANLDRTLKNYIKSFNTTQSRKLKTETAYILGHIYFYGIGTNIDYDLAEKYFLQCATQGDINTKNKLLFGFNCLYKLNVDYKVVAAYYLGVIYKNKGRDLKSWYYLQIASNQDINEPIKKLALSNLNTLSGYSVV